MYHSSGLDQGGEEGGGGVTFQIRIQTTAVVRTTAVTYQGEERGGVYFSYKTWTSAVVHMYRYPHRVQLALTGVASPTLQ
jgi:hypothetical protein